MWLFKAQAEWEREQATTPTPSQPGTSSERLRAANHTSDCQHQVTVSTFSLMTGRCLMCGEKKPEIFRDSEGG